MELRHLQTFQVVADELNITRAAIKLNYAQSTVSKHIQAIEEEIGTPLFEQQKGQRVLSQAGAILYKHSKVVLNDMFQLNRELISVKRNNILIRVGGLEHYCYQYFLPVIQPFLKKHPEVTIEVHAVSNDNALKYVQNQELDFSIAVGKQGTQDLIERVVDCEDLVLFISSKLAKNTSSLNQYIEHYPVLLDQRAAYIYYGLLKQGVDFPRMVHCNSDEAVKEGVLNHSYIGMLGTGRLKKEIESGEITILHTYSSNVPVKLFTHKTNQDNPIFEQFLKRFKI